MLLENLVTRRLSEENGSQCSPTRRVTKQGHLRLEVLAARHHLRHPPLDSCFENIKRHATVAQDLIVELWQ